MDSIIILSFAIVTIIVIRKILCFFPEKYFSIEDIVTTNHKEINLFGFLLRFTALLGFSLIIVFYYKGKVEYVIIYSIFVSFFINLAIYFR